MSVVTNIRRSIGTVQLKREHNKLARHKQISNLAIASDIGIVYFLPDEEAYNKVSGYVKRLQEMGKRVKAIGYVENKRLTGFFMPKLSYDFIDPTNLAWNYKPVATQARDFMETEFDILIDLSTDNILPLMFITGLSKAKFKTGLQNKEKANYLDLMISLEKEEDLDELIKQIDHYLSIINIKNDS